MRRSMAGVVSVEPRGAVDQGFQAHGRRSQRHRFSALYQRAKTAQEDRHHGTGWQRCGDARCGCRCRARWASASAAASSACCTWTSCRSGSSASTTCRSSCRRPPSSTAAPRPRATRWRSATRPRCPTQASATASPSRLSRWRSSPPATTTARSWSSARLAAVRAPPAMWPPPPAETAECPCQLCPAGPGPATSV